MRLVVRLLINAAAIWVAATILPDMSLEGGFWDLLLVALIFGLVNTFIRPLAKLLTLPLRVLTLGLFTLVVNALMLLLTAWFADVLVFEGGFFQQLAIAILAVVIISVVSTVLSWVLPDGE